MQCLQDRAVMVVHNAYPTLQVLCHIDAFASDQDSLSVFLTTKILLIEVDLCIRRTNNKEKELRRVVARHLTGLPPYKVASTTEILSQGKHLLFDGRQGVPKFQTLTSTKVPFFSSGAGRRSNW